MSLVTHTSKPQDDCCLLPAGGEGNNSPEASIDGEGVLTSSGTGPRITEAGFIKMGSPVSVEILAEGFPVWLLALAKKTTAQIKVLGVNSFSDWTKTLAAVPGLEMALINRAVNHLGRAKFKFEGDKHNQGGEAVLLVSGSLPFITGAANKYPRRRALLVTDTNGSYRNLPSGQTGIVWRKVRHCTFGGASNFSVVVGYSSLMGSPKPTKLVRTIEDHLDHSLEPSVVFPPEVVSPPTTLLHLIPRQRLPVEDLDKDLPLLYLSTSRWKGRLCQRQLSIGELGDIFGLPLRYQSAGHTRRSFPLVPLQILTPHLDLLVQSSENLVQPLEKGLHIPIPKITEATFLPQLGKFLPHSWIDESVVTEKAAKGDNAQVPSHLWEARITSVIERSEPLLPILRTLMLRKHKRRTFQDFYGYMRSEYGLQWPEQLGRARQKRVLLSETTKTQEGGTDAQGGVTNHEVDAFPATHYCSKVYSRGGTDARVTNHGRLATSLLNDCDMVCEQAWRPSSSERATWNDAADVSTRKRRKSTIPCRHKSPTLSPLTIKEQELLADAEAGLDFCVRILNSSWWKWDQGSSLAFWRWPPTFRKCARDGMEAWIMGPLPRNQKPASKPRDSHKASLIFEKIAKVLDKGYLKVVGGVKSLIDWFDVPKESDIRMVYNGTSCGMNKVAWAPNFFLPPPSSATRLLHFNSCSVDIDLGEMFLNFPLPKVFRPYSGVDFSHFQSQLKYLGYLPPQSKDTKLQWDRCWMGFRPSPFYAVRYYYWAEEFARGCPKDLENNPLGWDEVRLNLPGDKGYNPSLPRVFKWNSLKKAIAGDIIAFVDDLRASGMSEEEAWRVARAVASRLQFLGIQDAPRKRRPPMRETGAWAGAIFSTTGGEITQTVSQVKWDKARAYILELKAQLDAPPSDEAITLDFKRLMSIRGFLGHLAMTFETMVPFLKGFHLTLAGYLPRRDESGWKLSDLQWENYVTQQVERGLLTEEERDRMLDPPHFQDIPKPKSVAPSSQLKYDVLALSEMFSARTPPKFRVRTTKVLSILYGFCDASGSGFGSMVSGPNGIQYRVGLWKSDGEGESLNWREFENAVEACKKEFESGRLEGAELFLFTDNSTVEAALHKGNSGSPKLFSLVVRLKKLEMQAGAKILVCHVAGKRMIAQGTDGVSRGQLKEGVSTGAEMLDFIPLNETAIERSHELKNWISSWVGGEAEFLKPCDWFTRAHDQKGGQYVKDKFGRDTFWYHHFEKGTFIWTPPPAAAGTALEELPRARIKRTDSVHVFVCPRLLTMEWLRQLYKASDIVFHVPVGTSFWNDQMFEPLIVGICFPFTSHRPWQLRGTPKMFELGRQLRRLFPTEEVAAGDLLRKFLLQTRRFSSMSADVVWRMLYFEPAGRFPSIQTGGGTRKRGRGQATAGDGTAGSQTEQRLSRRAKRRRR